MPGAGLPPKPADKRARKNADPIPTRVIPLVRSSAPDLPQDHAWHPRTTDWWAMWTDSQMAADFTSVDWDFLIDTAVIHSAFWFGDLKQAAELRLRVAKFGVTPEDRARLRIVFADADDREDRGRERSSGQADASSAYGNIRAIRSST